MSDDPCPTTGLTSREKFLVSSSWDVVMKDQAANSSKLYMKLFEGQPSLQQLFPFRDIPYNDLPKSDKFIKHSQIVTSSFNNMVKALNEPAKLIDLINGFGDVHTQRGVDEGSLKVLKEAFLSVFSFMNSDELAAWNKCLDSLLKKLNDAVVEAKKR